MKMRKGLQQNRIQHTDMERASYVGRLSILAASLLSIQTSAFALQELNDQTLRQIDGQDGIVINTAYDSLHFDSLYWDDKAGTSANTERTLRNYINDVSITGTNLGSTIKVNVGSDGTSPGLDLQVSSRLGTITAKEFKICNGTLLTDCQATDTSMGAVTIQSVQDSVFNVRTTKGLFNSDSLSHFDIGLRNMNFFLTQKESTTGGVGGLGVSNQVILKDFNFNLSGDGYFYINDKNGITLETRDATNFVNLIPVADPRDLPGADAFDGKTKAGLNLEFMYKGGLANPVSSYDTTGAKGLIRVGASGKLTNSIIQVRGTNASGLTATNNVLGFAYAAGNNTFAPDSTGANASVIGTTGIATRVKTDFVGGTGPDAVTLELAHAGNNAYGVRFGNLTPLLIRKQNGGGALNPDLAYFDSGSVYMNLANTKRIALPQNAVLNAGRYAGSGTLTTANDYNQLIYPGALATNPNAFVMAIRGADFQALSRKGTFIVSNDVTNPGDLPSSTGTWGLGLPIYNLNANLALYGTTPVAGEERLGFALGLSTQGVNKVALPDGTPAGARTTSILLIDGATYGQAVDGAGLRVASPTGDPINYYLGLRNIDMLMTANGSISLKGGMINLSIPNLAIVAAAEVAAGYLPGSQYRTLSAGYVPIDNFLKPDDVLFGLKVKLNGSMNLNLVPPSQATPTLAQNRLSFDGTFTATDGGIQISDAINGSIIGFDTLTGVIDFSNQIKVNKDSFDFNFRFDVNKGASQSTSAAAIGVLAGKALRIKNIEMFPPNPASTGQRLGELVIAGGTMTSKLNIIPR